MPAAMAWFKYANNTPLQTVRGAVGETNGFLSGKTETTANNRPAELEGQNEGIVSRVTLDNNNSTRHWNLTPTTPRHWTLLGVWLVCSNLSLLCWRFIQHGQQGINISKPMLSSDVLKNTKSVPFSCAVTAAIENRRINLDTVAQTDIIKVNNQVVVVVVVVVLY